MITATARSAPTPEHRVRTGFLGLDASLLLSLAFAANASAQTSDAYAFLTTPTPETVGFAVAGPGDLDGDGVPEIVGSELWDGGGVGAVHIWNGATGAILHTLTGSVSGELFGYAVASVGDVDQDGVNDILVGATWEWVGNAPGEATVFSGANYAPLWKMSGSSLDAFFGWAVRGAGDVDADGAIDWIVGAPVENPLGSAGTDIGCAYVISGQGGTVKHSLFSPLVAPITRAGWSVCGAGDANSNGFDDVAYSTSAGNWGASFSDHVVVVDGNSGGLIRVLSPNSTTDSQFGAFSRTLANGGDLNGDGFDDLLVGDPFFGPLHAGGAYAFSGSSGGLLHLVDGGSLSGGAFGYSVCGAGDIDADGFDDFWVGSSHAKKVGDTNSSGAVFAFSGASGTLLADHWGKEWTGVGTSVANIGDLDLDGVPDCAAGSLLGEFATPPLPSAVYVFVDACGDVTTVGSGCKKGANPVPTFEIDRGCYAPGGEIVAKMKAGLVSTTSLLVAGLPGPPTLIPGSGGCLLEVGTPLSIVPVAIPSNATVYYTTKLPPGPYTTDIVVQLLVPYTQFGVPNLIASKGLRFSPP